MLAILYLSLAWYVGIQVMNGVRATFLKESITESLFGNKITIQAWTIVLPSGFLAGTLAITWTSYLATWWVNRLLPQIHSPLLLGDLIALFIFSCIATLFDHPQSSALRSTDQPVHTRFGSAIHFVQANWVELAYLLTWTAIWSFFLFRSFHYTDDTLHIGYSVFSDFSPHLGVIRSFSWGNNFPTEYPHFGSYRPSSNNISYHFLFQFLVGNLEYLDLRLDWAMNLPSILAMAAFVLLLYAYALLITGSRWVAIVTSILAFCRSSFAFFTHLATLKNTGITAPLTILSAIVDSAGNIGLTTHEDWGFYAQKVFVNKRHYIFALGVAMVVLVFLFPLYRKMIACLGIAPAEKDRPPPSPDRVREEPSNDQQEEFIVSGQTSEGMSNFIEAHLEHTAEGTHLFAEAPPSRPSRLAHWLSVFFGSRDGWLPENLKRPLALGLLLGLLGFVNGAVVITALTVLFVLAVASKHRLEYLIVAIISAALVMLQTSFFVGGNLVNTPRLRIGYLSQSPEAINERLTDAIKTFHFDENLAVLLGKVILNLSTFYVELLGFLPLLLIGGFFILPKGGRWLMLAFASPIVLSSIIDFTELPLGVAHVVIMFSVMLLNILAAYLMVELVRKSSPTWSLATLLFMLVSLSLAAERFHFMFALNGTLLLLFALLAIFSLIYWILASMLNALSKRKWVRNDLPRATAFGTSLCLLALMTVSGIVDGVALYNLDRNSIQVRSDNATIQWMRHNIPAGELILTDTPIIHPVLLSGHKAFAWGSYYTMSAGYDSSERERIIRQVFEGTDVQSTVEDLRKHGVKYIFVDDSTRQSQSFHFTDSFLTSQCRLVFQDPESANASIYILK